MKRGCVTPRTLTEDPEGDAEQLPFPVGERVAERYVLERVVAIGGMGVVYLARDVELERTIAVKCPKTGRSFSELARARFKREAQLLARTAHEGIVQILDYGVHRGLPFIAMEYLDGLTLSEFSRLNGQLTPHLVFEIALQLCRAVAHVHGLDTVHRDLKPANVMVLSRPEGVTIKLLDFGIGVPTTDEHERLTSSHADLGTACYMSPEQARGDRQPDKASDVYSVGLIIYEMLTGARAYTGASYNAVLFEILARPLPSLAASAPSCPPALREVVDRCVAADPRQRFPDCVAVLQALEAALDSHRTAMVVPIEASVLSARPWVKPASAALVLTALAVWGLQSAAREPSGVRTSDVSVGTVRDEPAARLDEVVRPVVAQAAGQPSAVQSPPVAVEVPLKRPGAAPFVLRAKAVSVKTSKPDAAPVPTSELGEDTAAGSTLTFQTRNPY